jgi:transposase-like protein
VKSVVKCPYCKAEFSVKDIGKEEMKDSDFILRKAIYYCPKCKTVLSIAGK